MNLKKIILLIIIVFPKIVLANNQEFIDMGYLSENSDYIKVLDDYIDIEKDEFIKVHTIYPEISDINFMILPTNLKIYELEVYYNSELIEYTPRINYYVQDSEKLYDNDLDTYYMHGHDQSSLILYLNNYYDVKNLIIKMYTKEQEDIIFDFDIGRRIKLNNSIDRWHIISFIDDNRSNIEYEIETERKYRYLKENIIISNNLNETNDTLVDIDKIELDYSNKETVIDKSIESDNYNNETIIDDETIYLIQDKIELDYENDNIQDYDLEQPINDDNENNNTDIKVAILNNENNTIEDNNNENEVLEKNVITYSIKETKNKNKTIKIIRIVLGIILLIIDIILMILKRKKKNVESI